MSLKTSQLEYKFVPSKSGELKNLLVLVHGRGGNLRLLEWYTKRFDIPDLSYFLIQAPLKEQREDQVEKNEWGWSWYYWPGFIHIEESRVKLSKMIEELNEQGIQYQNIYWMGFSQGGAMGLDTFLRFPQKLGGIICISGLLVQAEQYPQALSSKAFEQNIHITHGTRDEILSLELVQSTYETLRKIKLPHEIVIYDKPHSFHLRKEVPDIELRLKTWMSK